MPNSVITCIRKPTVGFMENFDTGIIDSQFIRKLPRAISRPVVDKQQLKILEGLYQNRFHAFLKI